MPRTVVDGVLATVRGIIARAHAASYTARERQTRVIRIFREVTGQCISTTPYRLWARGWACTVAVGTRAPAPETADAAEQAFCGKAI